QDFCPRIPNIRPDITANAFSDERVDKVPQNRPQLVADFCSLKLMRKRREALGLRKGKLSPPLYFIIGAHNPILGQSICVPPRPPYVISRGGQKSKKCLI